MQTKKFKPQGMIEVKKILASIWLRLKGREIEDRHYIYGYDTHQKLAKDLEKINVWSVILFREYNLVKRASPPKLFNPLVIHCSGTQLFFFDYGDVIKVYHGCGIGSSYRLTHGIISNALALLCRKKKKIIPTYVISYTKYGKLKFAAFDNLRVYGHDLSGNYDISREDLDQNVPEEMRIYYFPEAEKKSRRKNMKR